MNYAQATSAALASVQPIYQCLDIPLTDTSEERMRALISSRSRHPNRRAVPTRAESGLDADAEAPRFERDCSQSGVALQQSGM